MSVETIHPEPINNDPIYGVDTARREQLAVLVRRTIAVLSGLDMKEERLIAQQLEQIVLRATFKVMVLGEFKTGKSTFINALLSAEVLPSYATPTTAVINEVKWGEEKRALLHFINPHQPPKEIDVNDLEQYVVIKEDESEIRESPYAKVELFWPLELCQHNVEIIDSPGLNEDEIREKVTTEYLRKVDAVLFVVSALQLGPSIYESWTIRNLQEVGHEELFFIVNRFDQLPQRDQEQVRRYAQQKLAPLTKRVDGLHFISSLDALEARLRSDMARLGSSGIIELELILGNFLVKDRGRIKLLRSASELRFVINSAQRVIPERESMLQMPLEELRLRYEQARDELNGLQLQAERIVRRVQEFRSQLADLLRAKTKDFYTTLEGQIDVWLDEYNVTLLETLRPKQMAEKLITHLTEKIQAEVEQWQKTALVEYLNTRLDHLKGELDQRTEQFSDTLNRVRVDLTQRDTLISPQIDDGVLKPRSALERTIAAAGGWMVGGPAMAGLGAAFGLEEVVRSFLPQLAAMLGAVILGLPLLPVTIVAAVLQGGHTTFSMVGRIKQEMGKRVKQEIGQAKVRSSEKIPLQIDKELHNFQEQLQRGLLVQIEGVREQVEAALRDKEAGQETVERKLHELHALRRELIEIYSELDRFTDNLILR